MKKLFLMIMAAVALMTGCTSKESKQTEKEQTTMETAKDTFALGADPHSLNYFWILPPLMGILVQPLVVTLSDMVNERQKANAYSIQSFLCNAGSVVGSTSNGVNSSDWYRWDTIRRDYHEHHQIRF